MIVGKVTIFPREGVNKLNPTRLHQSLQKPTTLKIKNNLLTMLRLASFFVICPLLAAAFTAQGFQRTINPTATANNNNRPPVLHMSTEPGDVNLVVNGNNIDLTPALTDYVEKRIGGPLRKLGGGGIVRECDVHLSVYKNPKVKNAHRVDLTANLKGLTVHCKEESPDMYASIDAAATALQSKLRKYRSRRNQGFHSGNGMGDDLIAALDAINDDTQDNDDDDNAVDDFVDPEAPNVMKVDSFDLENAIPLKEAIFALDYVDHDFFVFKNEDTGKASVIYKRNAGGVGLIDL